MKFRRGSAPEPQEPTAESPQSDMQSGDLLVAEAPSSESVTVLAAVNLLPSTYARRAAVRRAKFFALGAVIVAILAALLGWLVASQKEAAAEEELAVATAELARLETEAARYAAVPLVFAAVADAQAQLELAMGNEVRWSYFLNDLALTMPSRVSLDTLTLSSPPPGATTMATAPSSVGASTPTAPTSGAGMPGLGSMSVAAKGFAYNDVANWLDSIAKLPTVADPYVGTISAAQEQDTDIVTYTSTGTLTAEALSQRYQRIEETP